MDKLTENAVKEAFQEEFSPKKIISELVLIVLAVVIATHLPII